MVYKHFRVGIITKDEDTGIFFGTIDNIPDFVQFEGSSMHELEINFQHAVDDYIRMCEEVGKEIKLRY